MTTFFAFFGHLRPIKPIPFVIVLNLNDDVVPKQNVWLLATETLESLKDKVDVFKVCGELYKFGYETVKFYGTEWSY